MKKKTKKKLFPLEKIRKNFQVKDGGGMLVYIYREHSMSHPEKTFSDAEGAVENTFPVVLDSNGEANIFVGKGRYFLVIKNSLRSEVQLIQDGFHVGNLIK